jgi:MYXO-CTERM domain-containing protein
MTARWVVVAAILAMAGGTAHAAALFPAGANPVLEQSMARHERQFYGINAVPFGLSLNAHIPPLATSEGADARARIDAYLGQSAEPDFKAHSGKHPFELVATYGEHGDLGFFGGVALLGTAFEYMTLKQEGAPAAELAVARARVVRAAEAWHIFYVVTGGGGLVARGIRRVVPEDPTDPPIPDPPETPIPLFGVDGKPLPAPKDNGSERADASAGVLPPGTWTWIDSCSKDQLSGQVLGMVVLYEAMKDDPDIDQALVTRMQADARLVGEMLMEKRDLLGLETAASLSPGTLYDLIIMDADQRATFFHDLNPLSLEKVYIAPDGGTFNMFNVVMAWGIIKGLHHITGDERLEAFLYDDLLDEREFPTKVTNRSDPGAIDYMYQGLKTNFDVPDMTGVVLFLAIWLEKDQTVAAYLRDYLEDSWWVRAGESHTARLAKQPLWHALYLASTDRGTDPTLVAELADHLGGFTLGPYWEEARTNCDAEEIAAKQCLAIDGKTILTLEGQAPSGKWLATEALHPSIRPTSDFNARSNSFEVNGGGGGDKLNPGGDLMGAFWMARYFQARKAGEVAVAKNARDHMPIGGVVAVPDPGPEPAVESVPDTAATDADVAGGDAVEVEVSEGEVKGSDGCGGGGAPLSAGWAVLALVALFKLRRRRNFVKV